MGHHRDHPYRREHREGRLILDFPCIGSSNIIRFVFHPCLCSVFLCSSLNGLQAVTPVINVTCWNSQHKLLQKLVEALDTDSYLQQKLKACSVHGSLKPSQIKMLKELVLHLQPFQVTTELFQKSAETVGLVIPCIMEMRKRSSCDPILNKKAHLITKKEC